MAHVRFQIGVPGAGSAARDAEASRERLSSSKPKAGSAARQAEEDRRAQGTGASPQRRMATIWLQGRTSQSSAPLPGNASQEVKSASKIEENSISGVAVAPYPESAANAGAPASGRDSNALQDPTPLKTAAARVRSLFRSVFSRPAAAKRSRLPETT